ncbi:MAG: hypothetical protein WAU36_04070 [Cyclobacteriaceae bacterium]
MQKKKKRNPSKESANKLGRKSLLCLITVNMKYSKFYFSAMAMERLELFGRNFNISVENHKWFLVFVEPDKTRKLTEHNGAYYFVDRELAKQVLKDFVGDRVKLKIEGLDRKTTKYPLTPVDVGSSENQRERNYFNGRIKTETIKGERLLNSLNYIL